ncbi:MAG: helix-turn-helix transcriptional regulator [Pseudorhodoplanes sp.]|nr:helix-turn-helix transcriptional regulator [Pseudorhodoplanes sp.]
MPDLLTTDEAAAYLRLSERKLYELVAERAVPCSKATGRWLFPKAALDRWLAEGLLTGERHARPAAPPIVGGSHDPLLEWALRESRCGLASLPEGSEAGLRRLGRGEIVAAAIHLHRIDGDDDTANIDALAGAPGLHDAVLIALARREQGLLVAPGNPLGLDGLRAAADRRARLAQRPDGAGAQLLLLALMDRDSIDPRQLETVLPPCPTGSDLAQAIRSGRADCGIATRSAARAFGLDFLPLVWERFDLVLRQRDYFLPAQQTLFAFLRSTEFSARAQELGGYDVAEAGRVRHVN